MTNKQRHSTPNLQHKLFIISVLLKGLNGVLELLGGITAFFVTKDTVVKLVEALVREELIEDPGDVVATYVLKFAQQYTPSFQTFAGIYLISHGIIKIFLIYNLLKRKFWAYPAAITIFSLFIMYQMYAYIQSPNTGLIALTLLDAIVIILTYVEYKKLKYENRQPSIVLPHEKSKP